MRMVRTRSQRTFISGSGRCSQRISCAIHLSGLNRVIRKVYGRSLVSEMTVCLDYCAVSPRSEVASGRNGHSPMLGKISPRIALSPNSALTGLTLHTPCMREVNSIHPLRRKHLPIGNTHTMRNMTAHFRTPQSFQYSPGITGVTPYMSFNFFCTTYAQHSVIHRTRISMVSGYSFLPAR